METREALHERVRREQELLTLGIRLGSFGRALRQISAISPTRPAFFSGLPIWLHDARTAPLEASLMLLDGLHQPWVELFRSLGEEQWKRKIIHSDRGTFVLDATLPMHVWHGRHHTSHIVELRNRLGWR
jgi:hypothetical protein